MTARILQFPPFVVRLAEEDEAWLVIWREHGWRDHAHQQCKVNSPRVRDVAASPLGVPLDLFTEQGREAPLLRFHKKRFGRPTEPIRIRVPKTRMAAPLGADVT